MPRLPTVLNPLRLLRDRSHTNGASDAMEFQVRLTFQFENVTRQDLEAATERALELVETRTGDVALGAITACDFETDELELDFTVLATRNSELHERIGRVVKVLEGEFPTAHERSSETEAAAPLRPAAVPA